VRHPLQLQSNCSRILIFGIAADRIDIARRRSSLPRTISHPQLLSAVRATLQSARWQFAIFHASTEASFFYVILITRVD
jgi:hypothetical protein